MVKYVSFKTLPLLILLLSLFFVACEEDDMHDTCECSLLYNPVCVEGELFLNECIAICNGSSPEDFTICSANQIDSTLYLPCYVTFELNPVCAGGVTYPNPSTANCSGWVNFEQGECGNDCVCDAEYAPVCVATPGGGTILTFSNACMAECEGYDSNIYYPCEPNNNTCPNGIYGEVIDYTGLDGCGLVIDAPILGLPSVLEPAIIPAGQTLTAGTSIYFEFITRDDFASICMVGPIIEITCLSVQD